MDSSLMVRDDEALMPSTFEGLLKQAQVLVKSGVLPVEIKTPEAAVAVILMGRELGIPPMQAFRGIYVVKGKPTLSAQLMGAMIFRAGHSYRIDTSTNAECRITFKRKTGESYTHAFTLADASAAGLAGAGTWKTYPKAMLFSRCMSAGARAFMPDVIAGMYTPEELAEPSAIRVDEQTGEVVVETSYHEVEPQAAPWDDEPKAEQVQPHIEGEPSEKAEDLHTGVRWGWRAKSFIAGALKNRNLNMTVEECMEELLRFWQVDNLAAKFGEDGYNAFTRDTIAALKTFVEGK